MIRTRSYITRTTVPTPGRLVAVRGSGRFEMSPDLHSPYMCRIKRVFEYEGQVGIEYETDHPYETGEQITTRAAGFDGATTMLHRVNGWDPMPDDVKRDTYYATPSEAGVYFGGAPQTITRLDARKVYQPGVPWKIRDEDPDPVFLNTGWSFRRDYLKDAREWIAYAFADIILDYPGSGLTIGDGSHLVLKPGDGLRGWELPPNFTITGPGPNRMLLFRDDYYNATPFRVTQFGCRMKGVYQFGNLPWQAFATHGIKVTGPDGSTEENSNVEDFVLEDCWFDWIPGYGINQGHPGGKRRMRIERFKLNGTTNDGMDSKGPSTTNWLGPNYFSTIRGYDARNIGHHFLGTMRTKPLTLTRENPIVTTNGSSSILVWIEQQGYEGQRVTFGEDTPDVAGIELAGRSFRITGNSRDVSGKWRSYLDVSPQVANAGTTGGGTGVQVTMPACNQGKPAVDIRGQGWLVDDVVVSGYMLRNRSIRARAGEGPPNGIGGHNSQISNVRVYDETPAELGYRLNPAEISAENVTLRGFNHINGRGVALWVRPQAKGFTGSDINIQNITDAAYLGAPNMTVSLKASGCFNGVSINGSDALEVGDLAVDPVTMTAGSTIVQLAWSSSDVNRPGTGDLFNLGGISVRYGADLNGTGWECIDASDPEYITFDGGQLPTIEEGTVTFGGESVTYSVAGTFEASGRIDVELFDMGAGSGVAIGEFTSTTDLRINGSYEGSGTPATGFTNRPRWGANSVGLPNNQKLKSYSTSGLQTALTRDDGGMMLEGVTTLSGTAEIPLPPSLSVPGGWSIDVLSRPSGGSGLQLRAQGTDRIRVGASSSSSGGTLTASTSGATCKIVRSSDTSQTQYAWYVLYPDGTLTLA